MNTLSGHDKPRTIGGQVANLLLTHLRINYIIVENHQVRGHPRCDSPPANNAEQVSGLGCNHLDRPFQAHDLLFADPMADQISRIPRFTMSIDMSTAVRKADYRTRVIEQYVDPFLVRRHGGVAR